MILIIKEIASSKTLKIFLEKSFSLELLLILYNHNSLEGYENIYNLLVSPKPKYPAFKSYLIYLNNKNCIKIYDGKIKKSSKTISLSSKVFTKFDSIMKYHEKLIFLNNK